MRVKLQSHAFTTAIATTIALVICLGIFAPATHAQKPDKVTLIVKTIKGLSQAQQQDLANKHGGTRKGAVPKLDLLILEVPANAADAITKNLKGDSSVVRVENDHTRKWQGIPSDAMYSSQWALPKIAWDQVYGNANPQFLTQVAILDTGVDATHPDLAGSIGPGTSIIDSSNGLTDGNGHGTWLAGIVAARTNNLDGIAGVGFQSVQVMPVKVLDANGLGQDSDIIQGVMWASDNGASVILMAFSNPGFSDALQEALDYAWSKNVVIVAAAGNDGANTATFPAGDRGVIGVSATDQDDALASFSTFGPSIFLGAPGVDILGTGVNDSYVTFSGTSGSAAITAGAAALMRAIDPTLSNGVIVNRIAESADPAGTQDQTGNGRVNVARAVADTSTNSIEPAGTAPVGGGGPFVGPYRIATLTAATISIKNVLAASGALFCGSTPPASFNRLDSVCAFGSVTTTGSSTSFSLQWYNSTTISSGTFVKSDSFTLPAMTANYSDFAIIPSAASAGTWTALVCKVTTTPCSGPNTQASTTFTVNAASGTRTLVVSGYPSPVVAGTGGNSFSVNAQDTTSNTVLGGYTGTVHFTSSDANASFLPGNYTFSSGNGFDNGVHNYFYAMLNTAGTQSITGTDTVTSSITGAQSGITVNAGPLDHLLLSPANATITAGGSQAYTAQGFDAFNNSLGNVTADTTFTIAPNGSCTTVNCTATLVGTHTVTGTDSGKTGTAPLTITALDTRAGDVAVNVGNATIKKLKAADGTVLWSVSRANDSGLAVDQADFGVYTGQGTGTGGSGKVYKYDTSGASVWSTPYSGCGVGGNYYVGNGGIAVDTTSGTPGVVLTKNGYYGDLGKVSRTNGSTLFCDGTGTSVKDLGRPTIDPSNGQIYAITNAGSSYNYNTLYSATAAGSLTSASSCEGFTDLNPADGNLYRGGNMASNGCGLTLYQMNKGSLGATNWSMSLSGSITSFDSLAVQPWSGGYIYVASVSPSKIVVVDPASQTVVRTFTTAVAPTSIAVNPAGGNVYIANSASHFVYAYSPTGSLVWTSPDLGGPVYSIAAPRDIVDAATPSITFGTAPTPTYLGSDFTVSATPTNTDSSTLTYSVSSGPCTLVSGATFHATGAGACVVLASGAATTHFLAASNTQSVTINNPLPTLTSIAPTSGQYFQTLDVVFTGTNFISGVSSVHVAPGINVNSTTVNSATQITANLSLTGGPATGPQNVSVANSSPGGGTSANQTFTVNAATTTTTAANATATYSASNQNVTLSATVTSSFTVYEGAVTFTVKKADTTTLGLAVSGNVTSNSASATYVLPAGTSPQTLTIVAAYHDSSSQAFADSSESTHTLIVSKANQTIGAISAPASATYNTTVAPVSATATSGLAVSFAGSGDCNAVLLMTSGTGTCTITASQPGDTNYNAATPVTTTVAAAKANQTIGETGPSDSTYGKSVTLSVTVTPQLGGTPTGTVTFSFTLSATPYYVCLGGSISTTSCSVNVVNNNGIYTASVTTTKLPPGADGITATYSGDQDFFGGSVNNLSVTVSKADTATSVAKSQDPSIYGDSVALSVTVKDNTTNSTGLPSGTVTLWFQLDPGDATTKRYICSNGSLSTSACGLPQAVSLSPDNTDPEGKTAKATVNTSLLPAGASAVPPGSYAINATYFGDTNFNQSGPVGLTQTVTPRPITVTAATDSKPYDGTANSSATPAITAGNLVNGDTGSFTQVFTSKNAGTGDKTLHPSGSVTDGNSGNNYAITFADFSTGTISQLALTVTAATNTKTYDGATSASATPTITSGTVQTGDTANFTETYDNSNAGSGKTLTPAGIVSDSNGGNNYTYSFVAVTTGVISPADTTTTIASDLSTATAAGQSYTVSYTVVAKAPGAGTPTGTVTITDSGDVSAGVSVPCSASVAAASCVLTSITAGVSKSITVSYAGDANFNATGVGTSNAVNATHTVNKADTTTTVISDLSTVTVINQGYTVSFTVFAKAPGSGSPTGNVTVSDGSATCNASVATGHCTLTSTTAGNKTITASYAGDTNFNATGVGTSDSVSVAHTVNTRTTSTSVSFNINTAVVGQSRIATVTVTDTDVATKSFPSGTVGISSDFGDTITGTCTLSNGAPGISTCSVTVTPTHASTHNITASFTATTVHSASSGSAALTVSKAGTTTTITSVSPEPSIAGQSVTVKWSVSVNSPGAGTPLGTVTLTGTGGIAGCSADISAGQCDVSWTLSGSKSITATYGGDSNFNDSASASASHTVNPAALDHITISPASATIIAGGSQIYTAEGFDPYNNSRGDVTGATTFTIATGTCSANTCTSNAAGTHTVTGTDSGKTATASLTVLAGPAVSLAVTGYPSPTTAGDSHSFTVTAFDVFGNIAAGYGGMVHFSSSDAQATTGSGLPNDSTLTLGLGTGTFSATLKTAGTQSISATDTINALLTGTQSPITVNAAAASKIVFTSSPFALVAGMCSQAVALQSRDAYGNPSNVSGDTQVNLSSNSPSSGGTFFDNPTCSNSGPNHLISSVTISSNSNSATFYYNDVNVGTPTITATDANPGTLGSTTQQDTILQLVYTAGPFTVAAGVCTPAITLHTQTGSPAFTPTNVTSATPITLTSTSVNGNFYTDVACTTPVAGPPQIVTIAASSSTASFYYKDTTSGSPVITATASTVSAPTQTETITPATASKLAFGQQPTDTTAGNTITPAMTVKVEDTFGNVVTSSNASIALTLGGPGTGTLSGTLTQSAVSGMATFNDLSISKGGSYTLVAASSGVTGAASNSFTINNPLPTLASIAPTAGNLTQTLDVVLTGTGYITGVSSVGFGPHITVNTTTVNSGTQITANITIAGDAAIGPRDVSVTNVTPGGGTATLPNAFTVNNPATTTTVASSVNPSVFGQSVTFTASVTSVSGTPTGTVMFYDGGTCGTPGSTLAGATNLDGSGQASFSTASLSVPSHIILACYTPTGIYLASSGTLTQTVNKADTTTAVSSSLNPSVFGQSVSFTATVSAAAPGTGTPTGSVTFKDGAATLGTGTLSGGVATLSTSALSTTSHSITAVYGADTNFTGSTSGALAQVVNQASTSTAVVSSVNPSLFGQSVSFTATVSAAAPGTGTPTGSVTFKDGAATLGTGTLSGGVATLSTSALSTTSHSITAVYGADTSFTGSTSGALAQVVNQASTSTAVVSSVNPSLFGQSVSFTATVSAAAPGTGTPTGSVQFNIDGSPFGAAVALGGGGSATSGAISSLSVANHAVTAVYATTTDYLTSTGTLSGGQQVTQATTTTAAFVSAPSVRYKDLVTLTAKVTPLNTASPLTGSVLFTIHSVTYGSANTAPIPGDTTGAVQTSVIVQDSELPGGPYPVTATFTNTNSNYTGSSGATSLTVIPRNASPYIATGFYTGDLFAWTTGQNSSTGTLTMTAVIKDANTPGGDVRAAKVTFYLVNGSTLTPISSAKNLPVGLIDATDGSYGSASAIVQLDIGNNSAQSFQIAVGISGGYTNNPLLTISQDIVTVAKPIPGGFIVGGGDILNTTASAGLIAGAVGQKTDFSFSVQFNKSGTNPQGKVVITFQSYYKADGTLDSTLHTYVVASNAISVLAVTASAGVASFSSKSNVSEQMADGTSVGIDSGTVLQMSLTTPPKTVSTKTIGITVQRKAGGMWFSSNWNSATGKTIEQPKNGGDLSVN